MLAEDEAGVAEDDEDEVDAYGPEGADDDCAAHAFRLEEAMA